ncbi:MAG: P-loop NTPase fold protein, partial [Bacteroidota bacterium]
MAKLLNNLPVEKLTEENDYLGVIQKANLIKDILKSNTGQFHEIKMFVLYGDWGSGKSTLMKYLKNGLE